MFIAKWPKRSDGQLSTAGTTATIGVFRDNNLYTGHVGDARIVLGYKKPNKDVWRPKCLTTDHVPTAPAEKLRILNCGGKIFEKKGIQRVVWSQTASGIIYINKIFSI